MAAGKYNFTIEQGATYERTITFYTDEEMTLPKDMSGYAWRMQIRYSPFSTSKLLELTSENGGIVTTDQDEGIIVIKITATQTAALNFSEAFYDLESITGTTVVRELEGKVTLSREITK